MTRAAVIVLIIISNQRAELTQAYQNNSLLLWRLEKMSKLIHSENLALHRGA